MRISPTNKPQILVTMGDPSGVGPEVIMKSMANLSKERFVVFTVVGDEGVMRRAARNVYCGKINVMRPGKSASPEENAVNIIDPGPELGSAEPGKPSEDGARKALSCLDAAVRILRDSEDGLSRALVTAPVSKEMVAGVYPGFVGHTEYLQNAFSAKMVTMVLTGKHLSVVPVTRHIPLREVAGRLSSDLIAETLSQVIDNRFFICGKTDVRIGVSALNPHGGEGGRIGREEIEIIRPAVEKAKRLYAAIEGPVPADVIFYKALRKEIDIVVSMYHDQCLAPFKMVDFATGVNMTLGLGVVRTSPDHGTAFDIAGKGIASSESIEEAIKIAVRAVAGR